MKKNSLLISSLLLIVLLLCAWHSNRNTDKTNPSPDTAEQSVAFARGADVSWLSQLESEGYKFYDKDGQEAECMQLLRDQCGIDAVRLRVWVDPGDGWNAKDDVVAKAKRAHDLGLRLMIDFHFSDHWADPGQQETPEAWKGYDLPALTQAMTGHITDVLGALKQQGITPEWVQVGNETADGFMYPLGHIGTNPENFAALITAGHRAVKAVCPEAITIAHTDSGNNWGRYEYVFGTLQRYGAEYDMMGVSLYPEVDTWQGYIADFAANSAKAQQQYGKPLMVCEVGMPAREVEASTEMMNTLMRLCQDGASQGIFWWEPEAPVGYNGGYDKGCFIDGKPTSALGCFK